MNHRGWQLLQVTVVFPNYCNIETVNSEGDRVDLEGHAVQTWIGQSRAALGLVSISCTDLRTTI